MMQTLLPMWVLLFGGIVLCVSSSARLGGGFWKGIALGVLLLAGLCFSLFVEVEGVTVSQARENTASGTITVGLETTPQIVSVTPLSTLMVWLALSLGVLLTLMSVDQETTSQRTALSYAFLLLAVSGLVLVAVSRHLLVLVIGLELATLSSFLRAGVLSSAPQEHRVVRQQFLLNLVSTLVLFLGVSFLFGLTGSLQLPTMSQSSSLLFPAGNALSVLAVALVLLGLGSRLMLVPCHSGWGEFFESSTSQQSLSLTIIPRLAAFLTVLHLLPSFLFNAAETAQLLLLVLALATMVIGSLFAYQESNLRRQLCNLILPPAGVWLAILSVTFWEVQYPLHSLGATDSLPSSLNLSLLVCALDLLAIVGFWAVLCSLERSGQPIRFLNDLAGVGRTHPLAAICAVVMLLSLAGLPPFPGFWGRLMVLLTLFSAQIEPVSGTLPAPHPLFLAAAFGVLCSMFFTAVVASKILVTMCWEFQSNPHDAESQQPALATTLLLTLLFIGAGLMPAPVIRMFHQAIPPAAAVADQSKELKDHRKTTLPPFDKERHVRKRSKQSDTPVDPPVTEWRAKVLH